MLNYNCLLFTKGVSIHIFKCLREHLQTRQRQIRELEVSAWCAFFHLCLFECLFVWTMPNHPAQTLPILLQKRTRELMLNDQLFLNTVCHETCQVSTEFDAGKLLCKKIMWQDRQLILRIAKARKEKQKRALLVFPLLKIKPTPRRTYTSPKQCILVELYQTDGVKKKNCCIHTRFSSWLWCCEQKKKERIWPQVQTRKKNGYEYQHKSKANQQLQLRVKLWILPNLETCSC